MYYPAQMVFKAASVEAAMRRMGISDAVASLYRSNAAVNKSDAVVVPHAYDPDAVAIIHPVVDGAHVLLGFLDAMAETPLQAIANWPEEMREGVMAMEFRPLMQVGAA